MNNIRKVQEIINTIDTRMIDSVRFVLAMKKPEDRRKILKRILEGYCLDCGCEIPKFGCHCENDE